jgi:hypothetical protein
MPSTPDDLPFRLAATLAIDLMTAKLGLDEDVAIDVAWKSFREIEPSGPDARFQLEDYAEPVRAAIRDIRAGRRKRAENPGVERRARARLGID